jgi:hypothetical protein
MILKVHLQGAPSHEIGDEIWQQSLADAIRDEAETIAEYAGPELLEGCGRAHRDALRDRIIDEMTRALVNIGDIHRASDGVLYSLVDSVAANLTATEGAETPAAHPGRHGVIMVPMAATVTEVLSFEPLAIGETASRRAVVQWSDGSTGEALRWYADEILICEGDLIGKTAEQLRSLHFRRDRDFLQD